MLQFKKINLILQSEKRLLYDSIKDELEEKIHILEEDKTNVDFSTGLWELNSGKSSRRRKADPMDPDRRKKPVTGIFFIYFFNCLHLTYYICLLKHLS